MYITVCLLNVMCVLYPYKGSIEIHGPDDGTCMRRETNAVHVTKLTIHVTITCAGGYIAI